MILNMFLRSHLQATWVKQERTTWLASAATIIRFTLQWNDGMVDATIAWMRVREMARNQNWIVLNEILQGLNGFQITGTHRS
jgi:hypothetical protein